MRRGRISEYVQKESDRSGVFIALNVRKSMSTVTTKPSDCELCGVIHFLYLGGVSTREIHRQLCSRYGEENIYKLHNVYYWVQQFQSGRTNLHDEAQMGRPNETVNILHALLAKDRHCTLNDLHSTIATDYSYVTCRRASIADILHDELEMQKVSAHWVPRQLLETHLDQRRMADLTFLTLYQEQGNLLLNQIVTGDES